MRFASKLSLAAIILGALSASAQDVITNVATVNVTPGSFSVVAAFSPASLATNATISVFSDSAGSDSLAGQVGIQYYPLNSGDPTSTNAYSRLLSKAALRQDSMGLGVFYARISYCAPGTTYYYKISATDSNGVTTVWPPSGPLPSATTAVENAFVLQSQQLLITLNDSDPPGSIIMVSNTNTFSVLAAVVGDGAATNQAFFNLNDLIAPSGGTNYSPTGSQEFIATLLGLSTSLSQTYNLIIPTNFAVGASNQVSIGVLAVSVGIGTDAVLAGSSGSVPISVTSQSKLVNLSFVLKLPTNSFSSLSVQSTTPLLNSAVLSGLSPNSIQLSFAAAPGVNLEGNQQIATLNFTTQSNDASAFVQLLPQSAQGTNADASIASTISASPGRLVIIGPQPLLDTQLEGATRNLVLYGIPGSSYQIQTSSHVANPGNWSDFMRVPMTNLMYVVPNLDPTPAEVFFRAYQFTTEQGIVDAGISSGAELLTLYGAPGLAYQFQYSQNLLGPWKLLALVPMTNSFAFISGLSDTNRDIYYRYGILAAEPPILQGSLAGKNRSLLTYGLAGTNYTLQVSSNLSATVGWYPLLNYTLTNSFLYFTNLGATGSPVFYRIQKQ
ncbi:MAG TPA: hypothetical protein VH619_16490 [Verrucomicrobiae bacterium]|jgi:hypothetical protein|nr:hypothetical protein [Verrucomicrobiae bacterium]